MWASFIIRLSSCLLWKPSRWYKGDLQEEPNVRNIGSRDELVILEVVDDITVLFRDSRSLTSKMGKIKNVVDLAYLPLPLWGH